MIVFNKGEQFKCIDCGQVMYTISRDVNSEEAMGVLLNVLKAENGNKQIDSDTNYCECFNCGHKNNIFLEVVKRVGERL